MRCGMSTQVVSNPIDSNSEAKISPTFLTPFTFSDPLFILTTFSSSTIEAALFWSI